MMCILSNTKYKAEIEIVFLKAVARRIMRSNDCSPLKGTCCKLTWEENKDVLSGTLEVFINKLDDFAKNA